MAKPAPKSSRVERWIVAAALWAFACGLFAGPPVAHYFDRCVEVGMSWLAVRAPSFLQSYLPKPLEQLTPPRRQVAVTPTTEAPSPKKYPSQVAPKTEQGPGRR